MAVPVFKGKFTAAAAERLLWRAGFGPRPGEAAALSKLGLRRAVRVLTRPRPEQLVGPEPVDDRGFPIAPFDATGHDHLWWLDRMVRTTAPLVERMTLNWHDWFATSLRGVGSQRLMLQQNDLFRKYALGSFADLLHDVTVDGAMLHWLNGDKNAKNAPNENYARELMELFALGADRAGGYTETDVREQARALTGWRSTRVQGTREYTFEYVPNRHDSGVKTVFGKSGNFAWEDSVRLCLQHPNHPSFFVTKLWSYFVPTAPPAATQSALEAIYRNGYQVRPVVAAILMHPLLYTGPRMVKPPTVYAAGMLRRLGRGIDTRQWVNLGLAAGQRLFLPPNVAGWNESRWLDTATFRGRWYLAATALGKAPTSPPSNATAEQLVSRALGFWGRPPLGKASRDVLTRFAKRSLARGRSRGEVEASLRQLIATAPELQTA
jgi:uncharacterized protein (DUF1800 family)